MIRKPHQASAWQSSSNSVATTGTPRRRLRHGSWSLLLCTATALCVLGACSTEAPQPEQAEEADGKEGVPTVLQEPVQLRVATYNIEDVSTADLLRDDHPRLKAAAATLQLLRPDIVLLNEIAYDQPGAPGHVPGESPGQNGQRFVDSYAAVSQGPGLEPLPYRAIMTPSNTGRSSGYDLDRSGKAVTEYPAPGPSGPQGQPPPQSADGRAYGNDSWGFGTYPGQYAMALLVREDLEILGQESRSLADFPWSQLPGALVPTEPDSGEAWYSPEAWQRMPLSSKTHWDVPVRLSNGSVLHLLASHPTPPAFDGPEERNRKRNHDEIRLWAEYLSESPFLVDDQGRSGGLSAAAHFVLLGDLNADPDEGRALDDPVGRFLLAHPRVRDDVHPQAMTLTSGPDSAGHDEEARAARQLSSGGQAAEPRDPGGLDSDDTARWGQRADWVLPSTTLRVLASGVLRPLPELPEVSDHFPVWVDIEVPFPGPEVGTRN